MEGSVAQSIVIAVLGCLATGIKPCCPLVVLIVESAVVTWDWVFACFSHTIDGSLFPLSGKLDPLFESLVYERLILKLHKSLFHYLSLDCQVSLPSLCYLNHFCNVMSTNNWLNIKCSWLIAPLCVYEAYQILTICEGASSARLVPSRPTTTSHRYVLAGMVVPAPLNKISALY